MYFWLKAFHIIFMVSWFAGLFYLPRLFVNIQLTDHPEVKSHLNLMAKKLYRFITPLMILTTLFGSWLAFNNWRLYAASHWFHVKMGLVLLLIIYHFMCGFYCKQLANGLCDKSHTYFRIFNEFPVIILFAAVILAVTKSF